MKYIHMKRNGSATTLILVLLMTSSQVVESSGQQLTPSANRLLAELKEKDTCATLYVSRKHGFQVHEHRVRTKDGYELVLHRLIHPSDAKHLTNNNNDATTTTPFVTSKKPYLLLHGLVGASSSFVRNVDAQYVTPTETYDSGRDIDLLLKQRTGVSSTSVETVWQSVADRYEATHNKDKSSSIDRLSLLEKLLREKHYRKLVSLKEVSDLDEDTTNFGSEFKRSYKRYDLPNSVKSHISNSLAFTLSNFNYDVWMLNLRGNEYSRNYNGRFNPHQAEYWNFNVDTLIREDLLASINLIKSVTKQEEQHKQMGLVAYSYSSLYVLGLLTKFPSYQDSLQPIVLMAPTMLSSRGQSHKFKHFMQLLDKTVIPHNGPFPSLARNKEDKLERLVCRLPFASNLCHLLETILYGRSKSLGVTNLLLNAQESSMSRAESQCGQTSAGVLHQIVENLSSNNLLPNYAPHLEAHKAVKRGKRTRRSIILLHSKADKIATSDEVNWIKDQALKTMTLLDLIIKEPHFHHTDFLFSPRNQYLVNGEIARIVTLFDYLVEQPAANKPTARIQ